MKNKRYIGEVDFFKFIFALIIMVMHIAQMNIHSGGIFPRGGLGCEYFFMVSGYFMCTSIAKQEDDNIADLGGDTIRFVWGKFQRISFP